MFYDNWHTLFGDVKRYLSFFGRSTETDFTFPDRVVHGTRYVLKGRSDDDGRTTEEMVMADQDRRGVWRVLRLIALSTLRE